MAVILKRNAVPTRSEMAKAAKAAKKNGKRLIRIGLDFTESRYDFTPLAENFKVFLLGLLRARVDGCAVYEMLQTGSEVSRAVYRSRWGSISVKQVHEDDSDDDLLRFVVPMSFFIRDSPDDSGMTYQYVKAALKELADKPFNIVIDKKDEIYEAHTGIISGLRFKSPKSVKEKDRVPGCRAYVHFDMLKVMVEAMFAENRGYSLFYEDDVVALDSIYAKRIYERFASSRKSVRLPIRFFDLRAWFLLDDGKYSAVSDFEKYVLRPAIKDIGSKTRLVLSYEIRKCGSLDRNPTIIFTVVSNAVQSTDMTGVSVRYPVWPGKAMMSFLEDEVGMTKEEMKPHLYIISGIEDIPDAMGTLRMKWEATCDRIPQREDEDEEEVRLSRVRYFITALRNMLTKYRMMPFLKDEVRMTEDEMRSHADVIARAETMPDAMDVLLRLWRMTRSEFRTDGGSGVHPQDEAEAEAVRAGKVERFLKKVEAELGSRR